MTPAKDDPPARHLRDPLVLGIFFIGAMFGLTGLAILVLKGNLIGLAPLAIGGLFTLWGTGEWRRSTA